MSIWQTQNWKELLLASNQAESVFEVDGVFVEKRSLGLGQFGLFVLGVSPQQKINTQKLQDLCKREKCLFVQVESFEIPLSQPFPPREKGVLSSPRPWGDKGRKECLHDYSEVEEYQGVGVREGYYKKFITPYTALINLSKTKEEILSDMKPKGRYNIGLAQKKGVEVWMAEKTQQNIQIFYDLMLETTSRDGFSGNKIEYYTNFLEIIPNSELIFTKLGEKVLSAGIFVFDEEISIYYYGASTSDKEYRNLMAPYLMQWFAIEYAKSVGSQYYDFLGVATPGDEHSTLAGVTDFKLKFTKEVVKVSEGYMIKVSPVKLVIFQAIKNLKRLFF